MAALGAPRTSSRRDTNDLAVLCVIGPRALDRDIVSAAGLPYEQLNVGGIHGMAPWQALPNLARFALAVPRAAAILRRFRPHAVLLGGGYVCAPVAVAAWAMHIPLLTLCVDVVPGWAVRLAARLSTRVAVAFPETLQLSSGTQHPGIEGWSAVATRSKARVTGYPLRAEFLQAERGSARRRFGLADGENMVLAFGGSLGAQSINQAVAGALERLLPATHVVHLTGHAGSALANSGRRLPDQLAARYHPFAYFDAAMMAAALAAADLVICRAGAATMAELPVAGTPAVLVPGDFSAQEGNARALAQHGAAVVIPNRDLSAELLADETLALLEDRERLAAMAAACRALARRDAADQVAAMVREIAGHV